MKLWTSLTGLIQAELLTADPAGALCAIADAGIALRDVTPEGELCLRFSVARPSYGRLLRLTQKRGETLRILSRTGLYWRFRALTGRPVLLAGLALLLCAQILIPTRIFFVRVSGNQRVPTRQILAAAESYGLRFGANRRALRSEAIKNSLLSAIPELKWAGVNTRGCVAVISVAEKQPAVPAEPTQNGVASVIAARDGVIKSLLCTRGTPLVKPGAEFRLYGLRKNRPCPAGAGGDHGLYPPGFSDVYPEILPSKGRGGKNHPTVEPDPRKKTDKIVVW